MALVLVAVLLAFPLVVSGCSSERPDTTEDASEVFPEGMLVSPYTERFVRCMRDAGWDERPSWSGGTEGGEIPADQLSAHQKAAEECSDSTGYGDASTFSTWTRAQIEELYSQEVETHECFLDLGLPSSEPPSLQQYIDTFDSIDQYYAMQPWLDGAGPGEIARVARECPPPTWFLTIEGL